MKLSFQIFKTRKTTDAGAQGGFTIIEVIVSLSLFVIVMVVSAGSLLSIINADTQSHQLKSVMDNLNFALDDMTRNIRVGTTYVCGPSLIFTETGTTTGSFDNTTTQGDRSGTDVLPNCPSPASLSDTYNRMFEYTNTSGVVSVYYLAPNDAGTNSIFYSQLIGSSWTVPVQYTANEVNITDMRFYVNNATLGSLAGQPTVLITLDGTSGGGKTQSSFNIQTSVTQRVWNI